MSLEGEAKSGSRTVRIIYAVLAWVLVGCILTQVFLAGMAIFGNPSYWAMHTSFVHFFEFLPLVLFILAFVGRLRGGLRWWPLVLIFLIAGQYATAHLGTAVAGALHPVNALLIFGIAVLVAWRSSRR